MVSYRCSAAKKSLTIFTGTGDEMKTAGIIVEYNPFHKGHEYHIRQTKELTGADYCVAVMSGNFVQRGEPALLDKYVRAKMALLCGADLILELPVCFAAGSAGDFAAGSISLLDKLGIVDFLSFGSECGQIAPFLKAAQVLAAEPPAFSAALRSRLKQGCSFPKARSAALFSCLQSAAVPGEATASDSLQDLFSSPNNILGLEYCTALLRRMSGIRPVTLKREGAAYHDPGLSPARPSDRPSYASALAIRKALQSGLSFEAFAAAVPESLRPLWEECLRHNSFLFPCDFTKELRYRLLSQSGGGFTAYADVSRELSDKIRNARFSFTDWDSLCENLKSRELTYSRISRALCHILLSLTAAQLRDAREHDFVPYARILGFRKAAGPLLSAIRKNSSIPLLSKPASAAKLLSGSAMHLFEKDILAAHIYESGLAAKTARPPIHEFRRQICIL